jgi:2'-5' RNA ligase
MEAPFQLPGLHLYEYLLVIDIPAELRDRIESHRSELTQQYNIVQPQTGRPNVSLVRFVARKMMEERIIQRIQKIVEHEKPFFIDLQDFGSYPMHAIFIRIANQQRVLQLIKNLKQARRLMKASGEEPHFLLDPNIVLAGRMQKETYLEAMKEYEHKNFSARFIANSFIMLKRIKNEKKYQVVKKFDFQCLPASAGQGVLFS